MDGKAIASRTESLMSVVDVELSQFENHGWIGDDALGAADALAKAEYENPELRAIGEEIGDVDEHNRITALALPVPHKCSLGSVMLVKSS